MNLRPGDEWGSETTRSADLDVSGDDADLAVAVAGAPEGVLIRFRPDAASDLARTLGLRGDAVPQGRAVPMDALALPGGRLAVNAVVWGTAVHRLRPWRRRRPVEIAGDGGAASTVAATTVAVLVGEHVGGFDVSPRGHPGDGVAELQVYALDPAQRRPMVARLGSGTHLPHPQITTRRMRRVRMRAEAPLPLEVDGRTLPPQRSLDVELLPGRYFLLI
jgi:hypothetical protein